MHEEKRAPVRFSLTACSLLLFQKRSLLQLAERLLQFLLRVHDASRQCSGIGCTNLDPGRIVGICSQETIRCQRMCDAAVV